MHISYISMNRILEKRAAEDEEIGKLIKRNGKCTLSDGRALSDEALLEKLHSLGIEEANRSWLDQASQSFPSAQALAKAITERSDVEIPDDQADWVWISLVCLWERWFPDHSNFEMLDDRMQEGYDAYKRKEPLETSRLWLQAWHDVQNLMQTFEIESIDRFDILFGGSQSVFNWVQDFSDALNWAAHTNPSLAHERIAVCRTVLGIAERNETDGSLIDGFRRDLAESLADVGEISTVQQLYTEWMREAPSWGWGWIGWADIYHLFAREGNKDIDKAEQILKEGLTVPDVEDREQILERLALLYEETDRGEEAARLREEIETIRSKQSRSRQWVRDEEEGNGGREAGLDEIIAELDAEYTGTLPEKALRAAQRRRDEITPRLIELLQQATQEVRDGNIPNRNGHLFALYLLTEFRAKEAFPAILEAVSLPGEGPFDLFGDAITEDLPRIFAELAVDSLQVVDQLIENRNINEYVRWEAARAYLHWVRDGRLSRDQAVERLSEHLRNALARRDDVAVITGLVSQLDDFSPREALQEIEEAFEEGLVDRFMLDLKDIKQSISDGESRIRRALEQCRPTGIRDTVEELRSWASYREDEPSTGRAPQTSRTVMMPEDDEWDADPVDESPWEPSTTIRNTSPKVGRNDPCPCGSGKKYKKCCGAK